VGFTRTLAEFLGETEPAHLEVGTMRELVLKRDPKSAAVLKRLQREHPATAPQGSKARPR
jgi:hypothetical protein